MSVGVARVRRGDVVVGARTRGGKGGSDLGGVLVSGGMGGGRGVMAVLRRCGGGPRVCKVEGVSSAERGGGVTVVWLAVRGWGRKVGRAEEGAAVWCAGV